MLERYIQKNKTIKPIIDWLLMPKVGGAFDSDNQCFTRDVFQARLDNLYQQIKNPLLIAVAGEIGNNSFDHNLGNWKDIAGVYFCNSNDKIVVIADRGQGIRKTISRVVDKVKTDTEAIEIAFTKVISGRSPEQRGNGLKFVAKVIKDSKWGLYLHSGAGAAQLLDGRIEFIKSDLDLKGCFVIIDYGE